MAGRLKPYREDSTGHLFIAVADAAELAGVAGASIANRGDVRKGAEGGLHLGDVVAYLERRAASKAKDQTSEDADAAALRKLNAQADKAELEVEKLRGALVPIDVVYAELSRLVADAQSRLLQLPSKLAARLVNLERVEIQKRLEREVSATLQDLSAYRYGEETTEDE